MAEIIKMSILYISANSVCVLLEKVDPSVKYLRSISRLYMILHAGGEWGDQKKFIEKKTWNLRLISKEYYGW